MKHVNQAVTATSAAANGRLCGWRNSEADAWSRKELQCALDEEQFVPYFQPKLDLATGKPACMEVLARWKHRELGTLLPHCFIRVMERKGLIDQLTLHLLRQTLETVNRLATGRRSFRFAINVSPRTLETQGMAARIGALAREYGIPPSRITLEITETSRYSNFDCMIDSLNELQTQGFCLSADDFGIGYSSLEELHRMPFSEIKIDRMFVMEAATNAKSRAIIRALIGLASSLDLRVVAEGIETPEQLEFVRSAGCAMGQGYYLAMPMQQSTLADYLGATAYRPAPVEEACFH